MPTHLYDLAARRVQLQHLAACNPLDISERVSVVCARKQALSAQHCNCAEYSEVYQTTVQRLMQDQTASTGARTWVGQYPENKIRRARIPGLQVDVAQVTCRVAHCELVVLLVRCARACQASVRCGEVPAVCRTGLLLGLVFLGLLQADHHLNYQAQVTGSAAFVEGTETCLLRSQRSNTCCK